MKKLNFYKDLFVFHENCHLRYFLFSQESNNYEYYNYFNADFQVINARLLQSEISLFQDERNWD